jgi:hypothetical protein
MRVRSSADDARHDPGRFRGETRNTPTGFWGIADGGDVIRESLPTLACTNCGGTITPRAGSRRQRQRCEPFRKARNRDRSRACGQTSSGNAVGEVQCGTPGDLWEFSGPNTACFSAPWRGVAPTVSTHGVRGATTTAVAYRDSSDVSFAPSTNQGSMPSAS